MVRARDGVRTGAGVALLLASASALAGSASGSLQVTATVQSACIVSGGTLQFGAALDPSAASTPVDASATVGVQCTSTTPYTVALDAGLNAGGAGQFSGRKMKNGSSLLSYQLYQDSARSTVWGDGTGGSAVVSGTGTGSVQSLSVYGRLPSLNGAVPGDYADTVTIVVTY